MYVNTYNDKGFDKDGKHKNGTLHGPEGYDMFGYDKRGFDKSGKYKNGTAFDDKGYDVEGHDKHGFNKEGIHFNGTRYNNDGLSQGQLINGMTKSKINKSKNKNYTHLNAIKNKNTRDDSFVFENLFKKHFPQGFQTYSAISKLTNTSIEKYTLSLLSNYNGTYELEDALLGALIIHVKLGNIAGYKVDALLMELKWSKAFDEDIKSIKSPIAKIKLSAENGSIEDQVRLGEMHFKGNGVEEDYIEALKWFSMAAINKNAHALNRLGEMYQYGYGVKSNEQEAVNWYKKAVEKGFSDAEFRLGWMHEKGRGGLTKDLNQALTYYRLAASKGHKTAQDYVNVYEQLNRRV
ncbi:hypothetical protein BTS2_2393 [Bacillus sp. TS-2]|nr:hypothetical protein BTS2_2393 [Bacillus sp. TS-2]